ncbi:unnamed protein product [Closterium sp. Yama58-4]|nr:unnamed protein product [Closterium sp. Yama58-4]
MSRVHQAHVKVLEMRLKEDPGWKNSKTVSNRGTEALPNLLEFFQERVAQLVDPAMEGAMSLAHDLPSALLPERERVQLLQAGELMAALQHLLLCPGLPSDAVLSWLDGSHTQEEDGLEISVSSVLHEAAVFLAPFEDVNRGGGIRKTSDWAGRMLRSGARGPINNQAAANATASTSQSLARSSDSTAASSSTRDARISLSQAEHLFHSIRRHLKHIGKQSPAFHIPTLSNNPSAATVAAQCVAGARLVLSTVSSSARALVRCSGHFPLLLLDEAAQLVEAESLVALQACGLRYAVLVGDPKQLPATVMSKNSDLTPATPIRIPITCTPSPFLLLPSAPAEVLSVQYRMHPDITRFPSHCFYHRRIQDGLNVCLPSHCPPHLHLLFGPYRFFHVRGREERDSVAVDAGSRSIANSVEAAVVIALLMRLSSVQPALSHPMSTPCMAHGLWASVSRSQCAACGGKEGGPVKVGLISPYARQVELLQRAVEAKPWPSLTVEVNTVDGFQGRESADRLRSVVGADSTRAASACTPFPPYLPSYPFFRLPLLFSLRRASALRLLPAACRYPQAAFSQEFQRSMRQAPSLEVINAVRRLMQGHRPQWDTRPRHELSDPRYHDIIHVQPVGRAFLIWTVDISTESYQQVRTSPTQAARVRVGFGLASVLELWILGYAGLASLSSRVLFFPHKETRASLGREQGGWGTYEKLEESEEEEGEGKSGGEGEEERGGLRQVVVTPSARLCAAIKRYVNKATRTMLQAEEQSGPCLPNERAGRGEREAQAGEEGQDELLLLEEAEEKLLGDLPEALDSVPPAAFPLVLTFKKLLSMVNATLSHPFHTGGSSGWGRGGSMGGCWSGDGLPGEEVDYERFEAVYWPRLNAATTRRLDASAVFKEIFSHIKGSLHALRSPHGRVSLQDYVLLARTRTSSLNEEQRTAVYALFLQYERLKRQRGDHDMCDYVFHVYKQLEKGATRLWTPAAAAAAGTACGSTSTPPYRSKAEVSPTAIGASRVVGAGGKVLAGPPFQYVYVDEVQDLTQAQIAILQFLCSNVASGFFFAGDTAQTIARGVDFRFQDVRRLFYELFLGKGVASAAGGVERSEELDGGRGGVRGEEEVRGEGSAGKEAGVSKPCAGFSKGAAGTKKTTSEAVIDPVVGIMDGREDVCVGPPAEDRSSCTEMPDLQFLSQNFRSHSGIVRVADSVVRVLLHFFPHSVDRLQPEFSQQHGEPPVFLQSGGSCDRVAQLFGKRGGIGGGCEFGAEQVILVRDATRRTDLVERTGLRRLVLSVHECKGLEFQVRQWTSAVQCSAEMLKSFTSSSHVRIPTPSLFPPLLHLSPSHRRHNLLCSELKQLYVVLTRARQRLWIYEEDEAARQPAMELWEAMGLVVVRPLTNDLIASMHTESSPEKWHKRGFEMFNAGQFEAAKTSFERARDDRRAAVAHAALLQQTAKRQQGTDHRQACRTFQEAAQAFLAVERPRDAAGCLASAGEMERAEIACQPVLECVGGCETVFLMMGTTPSHVEKHFRGQNNLPLTLLCTTNLSCMFEFFSFPLSLMCKPSNTNHLLSVTFSSPSRLPFSFLSPFFLLPMSFPSPSPLLPFSFSLFFPSPSPCSSLLLLLVLPFSFPSHSPLLHFSFPSPFPSLFYFPFHISFYSLFFPLSFSIFLSVSVHNTFISTPPKLTSTPPELRSIPPELRSTPPELTSTPPELRSTPPELRSTPPELTSTPPELTSTPPELRSTPPELTSTPPELRSTPPELTSIPPHLQLQRPDLHSPRSDLQLQRPDLHSPRSDLQLQRPDLHSLRPDLLLPRLDLIIPRPDLDSAPPDLLLPRPDLNISHPDLHSARPDLHSAHPDLHSARPDLPSARPDLPSARPDLHLPR